jgi:cysteinyl-tRNA synthetase
MTHTPLPLQFYNTLTRQVGPLVPLEPGQVKLYVCGPTVYDKAHLGHARCYITWDVLFRFLQWAGYAVTYARNVTDVDDKILNKATQTGQSPMAVATTFYESFAADMAALNVLSPTHEPRATHHIQDMHTMITTLIDKGHAYTTPDGSVYYRTASKADYGKLSRKPAESLQAGARVEVDTAKEHPADFALWKGVPPSEAGQPGHAWESPWGQEPGWGRPGWHIECSSMIASILGEQIDIHAGGADLVFPHHENEIAQSEACTGKAPFAGLWMHNGFVNVSGEKMSKSLNNFATIEGLLQSPANPHGYCANTLRYFLLTHHYRMPVDFTDEALQGAKNWVQSVQSQIRNTLASGVTVGNVPLSLAEHQQATPEFVAALADDLNTPQALAEINRHLQAAKKDSSTIAVVLSLLALLGFAFDTSLPQETELDGGRVLVKQSQHSDEQSAALVARLLTLAEGLGLTVGHDQSTVLGLFGVVSKYRDQLRAEKDWTKADTLREGLLAVGVKISDDKVNHRTVVEWYR